MWRTRGAFIALYCAGTLVRPRKSRRDIVIIFGRSFCSCSSQGLKGVRTAVLSCMVVVLHLSLLSYCRIQAMPEFHTVAGRLNHSLHGAKKALPLNEDLRDEATGRSLLLWLSNVQIQCGVSGSCKNAFRMIFALRNSFSRADGWKLSTIDFAWAATYDWLLIMASERRSNADICIVLSY